MNSLLAQKWAWIEPSFGLRDGVLEQVDNADLAFSPGGQAMTLGELFREFGEIEYSYNQSLKTFKQDFSYRNTEAGLANDVAMLNAWFQTLDEEMKNNLAALTDEDVKKSIDRGGGYGMPVEMQLDVFTQAILIFTAKASVYLRAMNKKLPNAVQEYIG